MRKSVLVAISLTFLGGVTCVSSTPSTRGLAPTSGALGDVVPSESASALVLSSASASASNAVQAKTGGVWSFGSFSQELSTQCSTLSEVLSAPKLLPNHARASYDATQCVHRILFAQSKTTLDSWRQHQPGWYESWTRQIPFWNQYILALMFLAEESTWITVEDGYRYEGAGRGLYKTRCEIEMARERLFLIRSLAEGGERALAERINQIDGRGLSMYGWMKDIKKSAKRFAPKATSFDSAKPEEKGEMIGSRSWAYLIEQAQSIEDISARLGLSICDMSPALQKALEGRERCIGKVAAYVMGYCRFGEEKNDSK